MILYPVFNKVDKHDTNMKQRFSYENPVLSGLFKVVGV